MHFGFTFNRYEMADKMNPELHQVFTVDPLELKSFVDNYVEINLANGVNVLGIMYTIDPVSQSFVVIGNDSGSLNMNIVLNSSVKSVKILPEIPNDLQKIKESELFTNNKGRKSLNELSKDKERVKSWLLKNMIPVVEKEDILLLDTLEIHPPYSPESCFSSNSIVLDRVQALLKEMKEDEN